MIPDVLELGAEDAEGLVDCSEAGVVGVSCMSIGSDSGNLPAVNGVGGGGGDGGHNERLNWVACHSLQR